ncbi:hypothetical protein EVG20_g10907, partial [Dentipellis fragilis]
MPKCPCCRFSPREREKNESAVQESGERAYLGVAREVLTYLGGLDPRPGAESGTLEQPRELGVPPLLVARYVERDGCVLHLQPEPHEHGGHECRRLRLARRRKHEHCVATPPLASPVAPASPAEPDLEGYGFAASAEGAASRSLSSPARRAMSRALVMGASRSCSAEDIPAPC